MSIEYLQPENEKGYKVHPIYGESRYLRKLLDIILP